MTAKLALPLTLLLVVVAALVWWTRDEQSADAALATLEPVAKSADAEAAARPPARLVEPPVDPRPEQPEVGKEPDAVSPVEAVPFEVKYRDRSPLELRAAWEQLFAQYNGLITRNLDAEWAAGRYETKILPSGESFSMASLRPGRLSRSASEPTADGQMLWKFIITNESDIPGVPELRAECDWIRAHVPAGTLPGG